MKKLLIVIVLLVANNINAQNFTKTGTREESHVSNQDLYEFRALRSEMKGTFQFQKNNTQQTVIITRDLLETIRSSRGLNETVILSLNENIQIVIPSKTEIESSSFEPLTMSVNLITNNN